MRAMANDSTQLLPPAVDLVDELTRCAAAERVLTRPLDRVAFASDASFYRLLPEAVVLASSVEEVQRLFAISRARAIPLTFRAAGTSLSGQSLSDGLLVEVARHWRSARVEDGGLRIRARPGMIGDHLNQLLRPLGRKIGPDPASIRSCTRASASASASSCWTRSSFTAYHPRVVRSRHTSPCSPRAGTVSTSSTAPSPKTSAISAAWSGTVDIG
jgi:D-lactate dehydrogenase